MPATAEEQTLSATELAAIRKQLHSMMAHDVMRTSKRSVAFLRYIVEETLDGHAGDLKERTIGVNVFGKALTYDTNLDHVVRTAASELRRRIALYYGTEEHRDELRILLLPGSYVPQFRPADVDLPTEPAHPEEEIAAEPVVAAQPQVTWWQGRPVFLATAAILITVAGLAGVRFAHHDPSTQRQFWKPLIDTNGPVLVGVGDVPGGPPVLDAADGTVLSISPAKPGPPTVPFSDTVTIARVSAILAQFNKDFLIRRENSSSFADLRERPVVLIGAFNNEWSLQLTRNLRFSLAMDGQRLYIRDRQHPESRDWAWNVGPHPEERDRNRATPLHDYALISRILDSETGHDVVILGGLYAYGTQAAGEFLASPDMAGLPASALMDKNHKHLQIVLDTIVTDGTPGPPHIVAVNIE